MRPGKDAWAPGKVFPVRAEILESKFLFFLLVGAGSVLLIAASSLAAHDDAPVQVSDIRWLFLLASCGLSAGACVLVVELLCPIIEVHYFRALMAMPSSWALYKFWLYMIAVYCTYHSLWAWSSYGLETDETKSTAASWAGKVINVLALFTTVTMVLVVLSKVMVSQLYSNKHSHKVLTALQQESILADLAECMAPATLTQPPTKRTESDTAAAATGQTQAFTAEAHPVLHAPTEHNPSRRPTLTSLLSRANTGARATESTGHHAGLFSMVSGATAGTPRAPPDLPLLGLPRLKPQHTMGTQRLQPTDSLASTMRTPHGLLASMASLEAAQHMSNRPSMAGSTLHGPTSASSSVIAPQTQTASRSEQPAAASPPISTGRASLDAQGSRAPYGTSPTKPSQWLLREAHGSGGGQSKDSGAVPAEPHSVLSVHLEEQDNADADTADKSGTRSVAQERQQAMAPALDHQHSPFRVHAQAGGPPVEGFAGGHGVPDVPSLRISLLDRTGALSSTGQDGVLPPHPATASHQDHRVHDPERSAKPVHRHQPGWLSPQKSANSEPNLGTLTALDKDLSSHPSALLGPDMEEPPAEKRSAWWCVRRCGSCLSEGPSWLCLQLKGCWSGCLALVAGSAYRLNVARAKIMLQDAGTVHIRRTLVQALYLVHKLSENNITKQDAMQAAAAALRAAHASPAMLEQWAEAARAANKTIVRATHSAPALGITDTVAPPTDPSPHLTPRQASSPTWHESIYDNPPTWLKLTSPRRLLDELLSIYGSLTDGELGNMATTYAKLVFANVRPANPDCITRQDLININIDPEGVEMVWELFDKNQDDEINLEEIRATAISFYQQRRNLALTIRAMRNLTLSIQVTVTLLINCVFLMVVYLALLDVTYMFGANKTSLDFFSAYILVVSLMFGEMIRNLLSGALLLIAQQPFDIGEEIIVEEAPQWRYMGVIQDFNLIFIRIKKSTDGELVTLPLTKVTSSKFTNLTRSDWKIEQTYFTVDLTAPHEVLDKITANALAHINKHPGEYDTEYGFACFFHGMERPNKLIIRTFHRYRFNLAAPHRRIAKARDGIITVVCRTFLEMGINFTEIRMHLPYPGPPPQWPSDPHDPPPPTTVDAAPSFTQPAAASGASFWSWAPTWPGQSTTMPPVPQAQGPLPPQAQGPWPAQAPAAAMPPPTWSHPPAPPGQWIPHAQPPHPPAMTQVEQHQSPPPQQRPPPAQTLSVARPPKPPVFPGSPSNPGLAYGGDKTTLSTSPAQGNNPLAAQHNSSVLQPSTANPLFSPRAAPSTRHQTEPATTTIGFAPAAPQTQAHPAGTGSAEVRPVGGNAVGQSGTGYEASVDKVIASWAASSRAVTNPQQH